jgi:hypothetical protein
MARPAAERISHRGISDAGIGEPFFCENQGNRRENGVERTSAISLTPAFCSIATNRSAAMLE